MGKNFSQIVLLCLILFLGAAFVGKSMQHILVGKYGYSKEELSLLKNFEQEQDLVKLTPVVKDYKRHISKWVAKKRKDKIFSLKYRYADDTVENERLAAPHILIKDSTSLYPQIILSNVMPVKKGKFLNEYYEFDTTPDFNSPNLWRYPQLIPFFKKGYVWNRVSPLGEEINIHQSSHRRLDVGQGSLKFPFRVTAMSLPLNYATMGFGDLEKKASLLTYNLNQTKAIKEVFTYVKLSLLWGGDNKKKYPLDTFVSGTAGCGHVNDLVGTFLELSGYRFRKVGGFSPKLRKYLPGAGHSIIEVYNQDFKKWVVVDSFLDLLLDVPVSEISKSKIGKLIVSRLGKNYPGFGDTLNLEQLFRYRTYVDIGRRLPMTGLARLGGDEKKYGMQWPLRKKMFKKTITGVLPEKVKIYVRARYAHSNCVIRFLEDEKDCSPYKVKLSKWGLASFDIKPRQLLGQ